MAVNLSMLPLPGATDVSLPVWQLRDIWRQQLAIIDGIRSVKTSYGTLLSVELDSLRYWNCEVLAVLDNFVQQGHSSAEPGTSVHELASWIQDFRRELGKACAAMSMWGAPPAATKASALKKAAVLGGQGFRGFGATMQAEVLAPGQSVIPKSGMLYEATRERTWDEYKVLLAAAAGLGLLAYALKR